MVKADIVLGAESLLTNQLTDAKIFSKNYKIFRKDRIKSKSSDVFTLVESCQKMIEPVALFIIDD